MKHTTKTKLLKRYEAEPTIFATEEGDPPLDFYSPFGPMIVKAALPQALLERINGYADAKVSSEKGSEFTLPQEFVFDGGEASIAHWTARLIKRYLAGVENAKVERVDFEVFWIVSQYASTPSPVHFHSGEISGVLYLKVPEVEAGQEERTYISGRQAGYINFLIGGRQRFSRSLISFKPRVGDFYVFPGWLLHGAEPFRGKGERRSMAFNAFVKCAEP
jgi:hypothetical protein